MAVGDIVSITIAEDGWSALIHIDQIGTGGVYDLGFNVTEGSASNLINDAKIVFNVTSVGYDDTGTPTTRQRTIYGTKQIRKPYPDQATMDEAAVGPGVLIKIALSDYIYSDCTNITATMAAGVYNKNSVGSNAVIDFSVTNSSIATRQKVIANWSIPGWREVAEDGSLQLKCVAFHRSAYAYNLGIACVKFSVSDGTHTANKTISTASIDSAANETNKVIEYIANFTASDLSAMTPGSQLACNFIAYPYIGNSGSVIDTSDGVNTGLTPLYSTQYNYLPNTTGDDRYYAYVKTGLTGGTASTVAATAQADPFATIAAAANAIATARGSNAERGIIRLSNLEGQSHTWTGGTVTVGTMSKTYITVETWDEAGDSSKALITNQSGTKNLGGRYKVTGCKVIANATGFLDGGDVVWLDNNTLIDNATAPNYRNDICYLTYNSIDSNDWSDSYSSTTMQIPLCRGNIGKCGGSIRVNIGNIYDGEIAIGFRELGSNASFDGSIIAFNSFKITRRIYIGISSTGYSHGLAVVQNLIESLPYATSEAALQISADGILNNINNVLLWNNTIVGQRYNGCYLDAGEVNYEKKYWSFRNNIFEDYNFKTDTFVSEPNGNRVGNWPQGYGCDYVGNIDGKSSTNGAPGFYNSDPDSMRGFDGLDYISYANKVPNIFTDYQAGYGGAGDGNYIPLANSVAVDLTEDEPLPYDLLGNDRSKSHVVGACCFSQSFNIGNYLYRIFNNV